MACIATIIQRCFISWAQCTRIIRVVCLLGRLRVRLLSLVWQVRIVSSECSLQQKRVVVVQVPFWVDPVQYRPVRPTVNPSPYREIQHRVDETDPSVEPFAKTRDLQGVRTMGWSEDSLPPTQTHLDEHRVAPVPHVFLLAEQDASASEP